MRSSRSAVYLSLILGVFLIGCATGTKTQVPFPGTFQISKYSRLNPTVSFQDKDLTESAVVERIKVDIIREVKKIKGQPFVEAAATNTGPDTLSIDVVLTRYERGNAAMRAALAGLGQIHVDGIVTVR